VKAANVMVGSFGQVYLMDWGIAELVDDASAPIGERVTCSVELSHEPTIRGTPSCMAPEQALGQPVDQRTDVFSVGALLYHLLCRKLPYGVGSAQAATVRATGAEFARPSAVARGVPPELERIVLKAMEREREDRYPSILDLQHDLVRFARGGGDFRRVELPAGKLVVQEGEVGHAAYIIEKGRCEVIKDGTRVREMGPGAVFGETAILSPGPRTATVRTLERTVLVEVTGDVLEQEVAAMKPWMSAFILTLAHRFRQRESERPGPP
jgi:serine/threonine-protein kinase